MEEKKLTRTHEKAVRVSAENEGKFVKMLNEEMESLKRNKLAKDINVRSKDDTEIDVGMMIKALKYCLDDNKSECIGCLFRRNNECTYDQKYGMSIVLDLIRRLQDENAEQKAEIELLTEERDGLVDMFEKKEAQSSMYLENWNKTDRMLEESDLRRKELATENAELQKQVDELMNRRIEPKIVQCHASALETCPKVEQAVKDTAKEIYEIAVDFYDGKDIDGTWIFGALKERYGVEVE